MIDRPRRQRPARRAFTESSSDRRRFLMESWDILNPSAIGDSSALRRLLLHPFTGGGPMRLLESSAPRRRSRGGTLASVLVHAAVIGGAVVGTAKAGIPDDSPVEVAL